MKKRMKVPELNGVLGLIYKQAHYWKRRLPARSIFSVDDLINEGVLIYYSVLEKFDSTRGVHFSSFFSLRLMSRFHTLSDLERRASTHVLPLLVDRLDKGGDEFEEYNFPSSPVVDHSALSFFPMLSKEAAALLREYGAVAVFCAEPLQSERKRIRESLSLDVQQERVLLNEVREKFVEIY